LKLSNIDYISFGYFSLAFAMFCVLKFPLSKLTIIISSFSKSNVWSFGRPPQRVLQVITCAVRCPVNSISLAGHSACTLLVIYDVWIRTISVKNHRVLLIIILEVKYQNIKTINNFLQGWKTFLKNVIKRKKNIKTKTINKIKIKNNWKNIKKSKKIITK